MPGLSGFSSIHDEPAHHHIHRKARIFRDARRFVDYLLHVSNDGHVSVREVKATGFIDGTELETIAPDPSGSKNLGPGVGVWFIVRTDSIPGVEDPFADRQLTARIDYNGKSKVVRWGTISTLR